MSGLNCMCSVLLLFTMLLLQANLVLMEDCTGAIGIAEGEIPDDEISASSSYDDLSQGARGRLGIKYQPPRKSGWCAGVNDQNQYLQFDLEGDSELTGVATQGRGREPYQHWVSKYYISMREEDGPWFNFSKTNQVGPFIFNGNTDASSIVFHSFERTVTARYVRIHPVEWNVQICMRVELYGCLAEKLVIGDDDLLIMFIILLALVFFFFLLLTTLLLAMRRLLTILERRAIEKSQAEISLRDSIDGDRVFKLDRSTDDTYIPEQPTQGTFTAKTRQSKNGNEKTKPQVYATIHKSKETSKSVDSYGYAEPDTKGKAKKRNDSNDPKIILVDADEEDEKRRMKSTNARSKDEPMETIDL